VKIQNIYLTVVEWKYRTCLLLWWSGNTEHVSYCGGVEYRTCHLLWWSGNTEHVTYCGGVEVQNMSPTVVEWNTEHDTYYGGVEIQNMSPTVMEWKYKTFLLLWWSGIKYMSATNITEEYYYHRNDSSYLFKKIKFSI
jgi:hypothetical protein